MYWLFAAMNNNFLVSVGTATMKAALNLHLPIKGLIKATIFEHFCGGETIEGCKATIQDLSRFNIGTILDYSVEGEESEASFDHTAKEVMATIEKAAGNPAIPFSVFKVTGIASFDLLAKVQRGTTLAATEQQAFQKVRARMEAICSSAYQHKVRVFVDGEDSWIQNVIDDLTYEMMEKYNKEEALIYNTFQLYRKDMLRNLKQAFEKAAEQNYFLGAKLVRGAYMEKERSEALKKGLPDLIQPNKASTDKDFDLALQFCVDQIDRISFCAGTHNEVSTLHLVNLMEQQGIAPDDQRVYFAQLYGMSDNISYNVAKAGYNVAKYVPYGPVEAVMPYLFRRAEENTAMAGQSSREFKLIQKEKQRRKQQKG